MSLEFNLSLRVLHYFLREKVSSYSESNFNVPNGLKGKRAGDIDIFDAIDNFNLYVNNKCGITHGNMDIGWNLLGVGGAINCRFFTAAKGTPGHDLRSLDFQTGRDCGESNYLAAMRTIWGIKKTDDAFKLSDLNLLSGDAQKLLAQRSQNKLADISFSLGIDFEDRQGQVLSPTNAFIIFDQIKRSTCGDRFYFQHAPFFSESKFARTSLVDCFNFLM